MRVLEVISSSETFYETALSFLKEFATRRSYSEITDNYQEFVMLTMIVLLGLSSIIHWIAPGPTRYAHWIVKLLYAMKIYIFCNQCDQEDPIKPVVVCFSLTRREGRNSDPSMCSILVPFFIQPKIPLEGLGQNLAFWIAL